MWSEIFPASSKVGQLTANMTQNVTEKKDNRTVVKLSLEARLAGRSSAEVGSEVTDGLV